MLRTFKYLQIMNTENEKLRRVSFLNKTLPLIIIRYGADFEAMLDDIAGAGTSNQILNYNAIEFGLTIDIKDLK